MDIDGDGMQAIYRNNIQLALVLRHMTQQELGRRSFMTPVTISKILSGKRALHLEEVKDIASVLNVSCDWLLTDHRKDLKDGHFPYEEPYVKTYASIFMRIAPLIKDGILQSKSTLRTNQGARVMQLSTEDAILNYLIEKYTLLLQDEHFKDNENALNKWVLEIVANYTPKIRDTELVSEIVSKNYQPEVRETYDKVICLLKQIDEGLITLDDLTDTDVGSEDIDNNIDTTKPQQ